MRLKLRGDRLLVVFDKLEEKVVRGVVVADKHSERTRIATIREIGPGVEDYAVGQRVLLSWYSGVRLHLIDFELYGERVDEDRFRIVREEEILGEAIEE